MKKNIKNYGKYAKATVFAGLLAIGLNSNAQRASVTADAKLGIISLVDDFGIAINANEITADKVIKLKVPVQSDNHGKALPAGSAKIKIGLGSKLALDPTFSISSVELSNYFAWSFSDNGGQVQICGELVNALPASVTDVVLTFKVKALAKGNSTITANFLVTNHNGAIILSDENGDNNASFLAYRVAEKVIAPLPLGEAADVFLYPNPVPNNRTVVIESKQGEFKGKYTITMFDAAGKKVQLTSLELNGVNKFNYNVGNVAAGKYVLQLSKDENAKPFLLKFVKL